MSELTSSSSESGSDVGITFEARAEARALPRPNANANTNASANDNVPGLSLVRAWAQDQARVQAQAQAEAQARRDEEQIMRMRTGQTRAQESGSTTLVDPLERIDMTSDSGSETDVEFIPAPHLITPAPSNPINPVSVTMTANPSASTSRPGPSMYSTLPLTRRTSTMSGHQARAQPHPLYKGAQERRPSPPPRWTLRTYSGSMSLTTEATETVEREVNRVMPHPRTNSDIRSGTRQMQEAWGGEGESSGSRNGFNTDLIRPNSIYSPSPRSGTSLRSILRTSDTLLPAGTNTKTLWIDPFIYQAIFSRHYPPDRQFQHREKVEVQRWLWERWDHIGPMKNVWLTQVPSIALDPNERPAPISDLCDTGEVENVYDLNSGKRMIVHMTLHKISINSDEWDGVPVSPPDNPHPYVNDWGGLVY